MPVEIKELVIRAVMRTETDESEDLPLTHDSRDDKEAIIQECVKQVLRILQKKKER